MKKQLLSIFMISLFLAPMFAAGEDEFGGTLPPFDDLENNLIYEGRSISTQVAELKNQILSRGPDSHILGSRVGKNVSDVLFDLAFAGDEDAAFVATHGAIRNIIFQKQIDQAVLHPGSLYVTTEKLAALGDNASFDYIVSLNSPEPLAQVTATSINQDVTKKALDRLVELDKVNLGARVRLIELSKEQRISYRPLDSPISPKNKELIDLTIKKLGITETSTGINFASRFAGQSAPVTTQNAFEFRSRLLRDTIDLSDLGFQDATVAFESDEALAVFKSIPPEHVENSYSLKLVAEKYLSSTNPKVRTVLVQLYPERILDDLRITTDPGEWSVDYLDELDKELANQEVRLGRAPGYAEKGSLGLREIIADLKSMEEAVETPAVSTVEGSLLDTSTPSGFDDLAPDFFDEPLDAAAPGSESAATAARRLSDRATHRINLLPRYLRPDYIPGSLAETVEPAVEELRQSGNLTLAETISQRTAELDEKLRRMEAFERALAKIKAQAAQVAAKSVIKTEELRGVQTALEGVGAPTDTVQAASSVATRQIPQEVLEGLNRVEDTIASTPKVAQAAKLENAKVIDEATDSVKDIAGAAGRAAQAETQQIITNGGNVIINNGADGQLYKTKVVYENGVIKSVTTTPVDRGPIPATNITDADVLDDLDSIGEASQGADDVAGHVDDLLEPVIPAASSGASQTGAAAGQAADNAATAGAADTGSVAASAATKGSRIVAVTKFIGENFILTEILSVFFDFLILHGFFGPDLNNIENFAVEPQIFWLDLENDQLHEFQQEYIFQNNLANAKTGEPYGNSVNFKKPNYADFITFNKNNNPLANKLFGEAARETRLAPGFEGHSLLYVNGGANKYLVRDYFMYFFGYRNGSVVNIGTEIQHAFLFMFRSFLENLSRGTAGLVTNSISLDGYTTIETVYYVAFDHQGNEVAIPGGTQVLNGAFSNAIPCNRLKADENQHGNFIGCDFSPLNQLEKGSYVIGLFVKFDDQVFASVPQLIPQADALLKKKNCSFSRENADEDPNTSLNSCEFFNNLIDQKDLETAVLVKSVEFKSAHSIGGTVDEVYESTGSIFKDAKKNLAQGGLLKKLWGLIQIPLAGLDLFASTGDLPIQNDIAYTARKKVDSYANFMKNPEYAHGARASLLGYPAFFEFNKGENNLSISGNYIYVTGYENAFETLKAKDVPLGVDVIENYITVSDALKVTDSSGNPLIVEVVTLDDSKAASLGTISKIVIRLKRPDGGVPVEGKYTFDYSFPTSDGKGFIAQQTYNVKVE